MRGQTVLERPRPDFDPAGIRAGTFLIYPRATLTGQYDSNVFADDQDEQSDYVLIARPAVDIQSDWGIHALNLRLAGELGRHADFDREDYEDYLAAIDGRLDLPDRMRMTGVLTYQKLHEDRGSANAPGSLEPVEYDTLAAAWSFSRNLGRIGASLDANWIGFDFDDALDASGQPLDQDGRDRNEYSVGGRVFYNTNPNLAVFVQAAYDWRSYDRDTGRDSDGYRLAGGVSLDFGGVSFGELFAGYRQQDYDDPAFETVDGFTYGARLTWNPSGLTTVRATISNTLEETIEPTAPAFEQSFFSVNVDHELRRNLLIGASASYAMNDYKQDPREDDLYRLGAEVEYLVNRNVTVGLGYLYSDRESNQVGRDYDRHRLFLRLLLKL